MEIRALRAGDIRSEFESGDEALDRFFRWYAGQNQFRHHLGVTYVAVEDGHIAGYLTVAPGQLDIEDIPASTRANLPRYPLPILRMARLAVDKSVQAQGIGTHLLRFACHLGSKMADDYGCAGIIVDAKPDAVSFYAKHGFVALDALEGRSEARPQPTMMFLATRTIKAAT